MALTVKRTPHSKGPGGWYERFVTLTFDSSYPTGGEPLTAADLGFSDNATELKVIPVRQGAIIVSYDGANAKLLAYWGNAGTASVLPEVTATTDLSAQTVEVLVRGRRPTGTE